MGKMVLGIFFNRADAEDAISRLEEEGYDPKDISIVMKDQAKGEEMQENTGARVAEGAVSGATTGGVIGALAGLLVGTGIIPGLGVLLIGGPIAAALGLTGAAATTVSGAVTGALAGGLLGVLTGFGLSREDARIYEDRIKEGGILLAVPTRRGHENEVRIILEDYNADQVKTIESVDDLSSRAIRDEKSYEERPAVYASNVSRRRAKKK